MQGSGTRYGGTLVVVVEYKFPVTDLDNVFVAFVYAGLNYTKIFKNWKVRKEIRRNDRTEVMGNDLAEQPSQSSNFHCLIEMVAWQDFRKVDQFCWTIWRKTEGGHTCKAEQKK